MVHNVVDQMKNLGNPENLREWLEKGDPKEHEHEQFTSVETLTL